MAARRGELAAAGDGAEDCGALARLAPPERLFLRAMRLWLGGEAEQRRAQAELETALGAAEAQAALRALEAFLWAVAEGATRRLSRRPACCQRVGADEARLCAAVSAAACAGCGFDEAVARLAPIIRPEARAAAAATAGRLGARLRGPCRPPTLH